MELFRVFFCKLYTGYFHLMCRTLLSSTLTFRKCDRQSHTTWEGVTSYYCNFLSLLHSYRQKETFREDNSSYLCCNCIVLLPQSVKINITRLFVKYCYNIISANEYVLFTMLNSYKTLRYCPSLKIATVWYSRVLRPHRHIIGHFGDDFTGHMKDWPNQQCHSTEG